MKQAAMKTLLLTVIVPGLAVTISCDTLFGSNRNDSDGPNLAGRWVGAAFGDDGEIGSAVVFRLDDDGYGCSCFGTITNVDSRTLSTELHHNGDENGEGHRYTMDSFPEGDWTWENAPTATDRSTDGSYTAAREPSTLQDVLSDKSYDVFDSEQDFVSVQFLDGQRFRLTSDEDKEVYGDYFSAVVDGEELVGLFPDDESFVGSFQRKMADGTYSLRGWAISCE